MTPYIYQDQYSYNIKFHFPRFSKFETQNRSVTIEHTWCDPNPDNCNFNYRFSGPLLMLTETVNKVINNVSTQTYKHISSCKTDGLPFHPIPVL